MLKAIIPCCTIMKSLITYCAFIDVGFVNTKALVVAGKQHKDCGWITLATRLTAVYAKHILFRN